MSTPDKTSRLEAALAPAQDTVEHLWSMLIADSAQHQRVLFTSVHPKEGSTTLATSAAIGLARHLMESVVILQANLYSPDLTDTLKLQPGPGFSELLTGQANLEDVLRPTGIRGLSLITTGSQGLTSYLGASAVRTVIDEVSRHCDYLVIDAPPLLEYSEGRILLPLVDGVVLVTSAGSTDIGDVKTAKRIVEASNTPLIGAVLNQYKKIGPTWLTRG